MPIRQESDDRLDEELRAATEVVSQLQKVLEQRETQLEAVLTELTRSKSDLERAQKSLDMLHRSTSWRLTAPFRSLVQAVASASTAFSGRGRRDTPQTPTDDANDEAAIPSMEPDGRASVPVAPGSSFDFLYMIGCLDGESKRYRVFNQIEALRAAGFRAVAFGAAQAAQLAALRIWATRVIMFRADWNAGCRDYFSFARGRGSVTVFDVDDLVFEPDSIKYVRAFNKLPAQEKRLYVAGVSGYRAMLLQCDRATVTTQFLADRVALLGKPVDVVPNTLNAAQIALAETGIAGKRSGGKSLIIGYFSGSATHDHDFAACEGALIGVLEQHPDVRLRIVGPLQLSSAFDKFGARIERLPVMPYLTMLEALAQVDINLAPLEIGNPFCEGKSQLKIFEAGLVGVPTIASRIDSYAEAIEHGVDGFLAAGQEEWRTALQRLLSTPQLRIDMGRHARERALRQFAPPALLERLQGLYKLVPRDQSGARPSAVPLEGAAMPSARSVRSIRINFIVPGLIIGGGGHRNILRAAYHLSRFGHEVRLYFINTEETAERLADLIHAHFFPLNCPVAVYEGEMAQADVIFATHWSTVATALQQRARCSEIFYFVQDFEPMFYPMGSDHIMAENTYRLGLYHITSGPWCAEVLRRQFNADADSFVFPIQTDVYYPRPRTKSNLNLLFFAKPEMPRRCFELGVQGLRLIKEARPSVEIITFGSDEVTAESLPFPATRKGLVRRLDDLALLYSNADLGIVFSPTNPSLVPFEMLACGLPVVDLNRPGAEVNFANRRDIALLASTDPRIFAQQVLTLLDDQEGLKRRAAAGREFVKTFPDEEGMARRFESLILNRLRKNIGLAAD